MRFGHELVEAAWDDERQVWNVETSQGTLTADVLVSGVGGLSEPRLPDIPGHRELRGRGLPLGAVGSRLRSRGQARRGGRHRRLLDPDRSPDPAEGGQAARSSSARRRGSCRSAIAPMSRAERALYRFFPPAQLAMRALIYWARELFVLGFMKPRRGRPQRARVPAPPAQAGAAGRAAREAHAEVPDGLQARADLRSLLPRPAAAERRAGHGLDRRDHPEGRSAPPTARSTSSTRSCSAPASTSPTCRSPSGCAAPTGACSTRSGRAARRPTWASRSAASRTCSCCSGRTRRSGTTPSSS